MPLTRRQLGLGSGYPAGGLEVLPDAWVYPPVIVGRTRMSLRWRESPPRVSATIATRDALPPGGVAGPAARLMVRPGPDPGHVHLEWQLRWPEALVAAVEFPVSVEIDEFDEGSLMLPGLHYGWESAPVSSDRPGYGLHPRLDPTLGFSVRADRLPQVAVVAGDVDRSWGLFALTETPAPPRAGLLYSVFAGPEAPSRMRLGLRYPQAEHGHDRGGELAYVAKGIFGHGEDRRTRWEEEDRLTVPFELLSLPGPSRSNVGAVPRHLWALAHPRWHGSVPPSRAAAERARWSERHLWNPDLTQYESPEGSGTALAGFVEMSLSLACVLARLESFDVGAPPAHSNAFAAIDAWLSDGIDDGGRLLPIRDRSGFHTGRRRYDADPDDDLTDEPVIESIRPAVECRSILGLLRQAPAWLSPEKNREWRGQVVRVVRWLSSQRQNGVLPSVLGALALERDDRGSAHFVALLGDLAMDAPRRADADELLRLAMETYRLSVAHQAERRAFGGVTLDAACPDREAVAAALDASLVMYETTDDDRYLRDAAVAADTLLTYVYAYQVETFDAASDAGEHGISTLGASLVSAENQHLDPYPVGPLLVRFGLYADDAVAVKAGIANTAWCLDGRWAIHGADGIKQPEQFCHTAWHYDAFFTQRGDFRRGMPIHGRSDSEHGWAQALPLSALLDQGHVTLDWPTGRVASLPGWQARAEPRGAGFRVEVAVDSPEPLAEPQILLRILRPPPDQSIEIASSGSKSVSPWPATLVSLPLDAASGATLLSAVEGPALRNR